MKNINRRTVKSITRNALFISMIFHVFFLITLFYFSLRTKSVPYFQDRVDVTITTARKTPLLKKPMKMPMPQQRKSTVYEPTKVPFAKVESITPQMAFQPQPTPISPAVAAQPRLKQTNTAPDVKANVSTALRELRQVENGLSSTESAQSPVGSIYGSKRSGMVNIQRTPPPGTLDIVGTTDADDDIPTIGELHTPKPSLPFIPFGTVMKDLANAIAETSEGGPIDVVFIIDASGSMADNIVAVAEHLTDMIDVYRSSDIDYALGLTHFSAGNKKNIVRVFQLTKKLSVYKRNLYAIVPGGDENALDAIEQTVEQMRFRAASKKHFILVTDEPLTSLKNLTFRDSITLCREFGIYVNVLGIHNFEHTELAKDTEGKWHPIPANSKKQQTARQRNTPQTVKARTRGLRKAQWQNVQSISKVLLQNSGNTPVDIVLFIDASKSMEDKLPKFLQQLDIWIRAWDNALIDYQIGVVRFRSRQAVNIVNVYNLPLTHDQVRKIIELPCQEDENLLHAVTEGLRRIKLRPEAKTHLILVTDEPVSKNASSSGIIQFLKEKHAVVSVIGTYDNFQLEVALKTGGVWVPIPKGHVTNNVNW